MHVVVAEVTHEKYTTPTFPQASTNSVPQTAAPE